jgi:hypothetical protein
MQPYIQPGAVRSGIFGGFGHYVQPEAIQSGIFGGFGAYVQPGAIRDGVFGAAGDLVALTQTVDGLTFMTASALALWQSAMQLSACPVPAPTTDIVLKLGVDPSCQSLAAVLAAAPAGSVALVSPADLMTIPSATATSPPAVTITITSNPQVVAQLAGAGMAYAITDTASSANQVVAAAKTIAKGKMAGAAAGGAVAAHIFGLSTTALIAVGVGGLVIWAFAKKKR